MSLKTRYWAKKTVTLALMAPEITASTLMVSR